jgi:hypothetical protein
VNGGVNGDVHGREEVKERSVQTNAARGEEKRWDGRGRRWYGWYVPEVAERMRGEE